MPAAEAPSALDLPVTPTLDLTRAAGIDGAAGVDGGLFGGPPPLVDEDVAPSRDPLAAPDRTDPLARHIGKALARPGSEPASAARDRLDDVDADVASDVDVDVSELALGELNVTDEQPPESDSWTRIIERAGLDQPRNAPETP